MTVLLSNCSQAVSSTEMARNFGAKLREVTTGDMTHLVIFKDNKPTGCWWALRPIKPCRLSWQV